MNRIYVKPSKKGAVVLDELDRKIPAAGAAVNKTTFISRLIKEGCLKKLNKTEVKELEASKASNAKKQAAKLKAAADEAAPNAAKGGK